jgi:hypothetical protein
MIPTLSRLSQFFDVKERSNVAAAEKGPFLGLFWLSNREVATYESPWEKIDR